jgi:hypothetical protein
VHLGAAPFFLPALAVIFVAGFTAFVAGLDKPKPENNCASYWPERSYWQEDQNGVEDKLTRTLATTKSSSCSITWPILVVNVSGIEATKA